MRNELPIVTARSKCELEDAKGFVIVHFAIGFCRTKWREIFAADADDELANAMSGIRLSLRILRRETLVIVIVSTR